MKQAEIQSWNPETHDAEPMFITMASRVKLGIENQPIVYISVWADLHDIRTIEEMADYINELDFNIEVMT